MSYCSYCRRETDHNAGNCVHRRSEVAADARHRSLMAEEKRRTRLDEEEAEGRRNERETRRLRARVADERRDVQDSAAKLLHAFRLQMKKARRAIEVDLIRAHLTFLCLQRDSDDVLSADHFTESGLVGYTDFVDDLSVSLEETSAALGPDATSAIDEWMSLEVARGALARKLGRARDRCREDPAASAGAAECTASVLSQASADARSHLAALEASAPTQPLPDDAMRVGTPLGEGVINRLAATLAALTLGPVLLYGVADKCGVKPEISRDVENVLVSCMSACAALLIIAVPGLLVLRARRRREASARLSAHSAWETVRSAAAKSANRLAKVRDASAALQAFDADEGRGARLRALRAWAPAIQQHVLYAALDEGDFPES